MGFIRIQIMGPVGSLVHKRGALPPTCVWDTMSRPEDNIQVTDLSNWRHAISLGLDHQENSPESL